MINLLEEDWFMPGVKYNKVQIGESAKQIAVVIDGEIAFFMGLKEEIANKVMGATEFSECVPLGELFCTSFVYNEETERILSNEMTQAGLLSDPEFVYVDKSVQRHAELAEVGWLYVDGQFIVPGVYE